jgi:DNA-binding SARP family transcriptional activator
VSIRVALFGQPRVLSQDGTQEYALPRKTLNVLAYLILHRARAPARDSIAFALFPDEDEEQARGSLRRNLSYLLSALPDGKQFVKADGERIAWNPDAPAHVDVIAFEHAIAEGRDADALGEYAGQLLPTIYDEWTTADRERLRDAYHEALVRTVSRERSHRRFDAAATTARRLLDEDPWREDVVRELIAIRYEAGDRAGALAAFDRFAARLRAEMQADPMPETVSLRDAVLRGARLATSEPRAAGAVGAGEPGLPFVGRDAAMERARARWHSAADGRCGVLFVSGEAGAGKSRFVTELARLVEREGGKVVRGYTSAGGEHRPYEAFVEALHDAPQLLDDYAGATLGDDRAARVRLFDSVRKRLSQLAHARPLVLVLEDLHWAGAATISLLEYVADRLERSPVLLVATFRSDEIVRAHPLRSLRRHLQSRSGAVEVPLDRLSFDDAMTAARAVSLDAIGTDALERAVTWSGGVPLLLAEALRDLAAGRPTSALDIAGLVGERLARLSAQAGSALVFGSLLGERFDLGVLAAVTGWRDDEVVEAIGEAIEGGLLRATTGAPGLAFAFTHDLIRAAAVERVPQVDRVRAHGLIARALVALGEPSGARAAEIARHFAAAGEPLRAAECWRDAARYALGVFANDDAREAATMGLELCDPLQPSARELRYELLALREQSSARLGSLEQQRADARALVEAAPGDAALCEAYSRLFEAHRDDAAMRVEALAGLAAVAQRFAPAAAVHEHAVAKDAFARSDYALARDAALRATRDFEAAGNAREAFAARCLHVNVLARFGAFDRATEAVDAMRATIDAGDDLAMRAEFYRIASSAAGDERREAAIADARRSLDLALRIGDRYAEARARHNVAALVGKLGGYEEADEENRRAIEAYRDVGDATGVADATLNLAGLRLFCGDFSETRRLLDAIDAPSRSRPWVLLRSTVIGGMLAVRRHELELAERLLLEALDRAESLGAALYVARARLDLASAYARGLRADAREHVDRAIAELGPLSQPSLLCEAYARSAQIAASAGDRARASEHAANAERLAGTVVVQSYSEVAWNLAATRALLGESAAVDLAQACVAAGVRDALRMPADLAETYLRLPWHRHASAFLAGRSVPLRIEDDV